MVNNDAVVQVQPFLKIDGKYHKNPEFKEIEDEYYEKMFYHLFIKNQTRD